MYYIPVQVHADFGIGYLLNKSVLRCSLKTYQNSSNYKKTDEIVCDV